MVQARVVDGKERDSESGLDNFGARYDYSQYGRFMSPDPVGNAVAIPPQSWNMYSYVLNNPLSFIDPTGLDCVYLNDEGNGLDNSSAPIDHNSNLGEWRVGAAFHHPSRHSQSHPISHKA